MTLNNMAIYIAKHLFSLGALTNTRFVRPHVISATLRNNSVSRKSRHWPWSRQDCYLRGRWRTSWNMSVSSLWHGRHKTAWHCLTARWSSSWKKMCHLRHWPVLLGCHFIYYFSVSQAIYPVKQLFYGIVQDVTPSVVWSVDLVNILSVSCDIGQYKTVVWSANLVTTC